MKDPTESLSNTDAGKRKPGIGHTIVMQFVWYFISTIFLFVAQTIWKLISNYLIFIFVIPFLPWILLGGSLIGWGITRRSTAVAAISSIILAIVTVTFLTLKWNLTIGHPTVVHFYSPEEIGEGTGRPIRPDSEIYVKVEDEDGIKNTTLYVDGSPVPKARGLVVEEESETTWTLTYAPSLEFQPITHTVEIRAVDKHFVTGWHPVKKKLEFPVIAHESFDKELVDDPSWGVYRGSWSTANGRLIGKVNGQVNARITYYRFKGFYFSRYVHMSFVAYPRFSPGPKFPKMANIVIYFGKNYTLIIGDGDTRTITLRKFGASRIVDSGEFRGYVTGAGGNHITCSSILDEKERVQKFIVTLNGQDQVILYDEDPFDFEGYIGLGVWRGNEGVSFERFRISGSRESPFVVP